MRYYATVILVDVDTGYALDEQTRVGETELEAKERARKAVGAPIAGHSYARLVNSGPVSPKVATGRAKVTAAGRAALAEHPRHLEG